MFNEEIKILLDRLLNKYNYSNSAVAVLTELRDKLQEGCSLQDLIKQISNIGLNADPKLCEDRLKMKILNELQYGISSCFIHSSMLIYCLSRIKDQLKEEIINSKTIYKMTLLKLRSRIIRLYKKALKSQMNFCDILNQTIDIRQDILQIVDLKNFRENYKWWVLLCKEIDYFSN